MLTGATLYAVVNADSRTVSTRPVTTWLIRLTVALSIAAVTLWVHLYEFNGMTRWDSAAFLSIGKLLTRGLLLYRDLWDTKPPGIYLYQWAVFSTLPIQVWSLRLTDFAFYLAGAAAFYRLCAVEARWPLALAATAVWVFFGHHPAFNIAGFYTEEYSAICGLIAVAAAAQYLRHGRFRAVVLSGAAAAAAVIFKHPGVACAVPAAVLLTGRKPIRALSLFAVSAALPLALVVGYFWWHGALAELLDCQFWYLLTQHGVTRPGAAALWPRLQELAAKTSERFVPYPALLIPGAVGTAVCFLRPNRLRLAALLWLVTDLLLIGAQKFYYEHYFIQVFPSLILVGVIGVAWVVQPRPGERWFVTVPRLALALAALVAVWPRLAEVVWRRQPVVAQAWATLLGGPAQWPHGPGGAFEAEIGDYLNARTQPDERILIFETGTALAAYWTADRLPASRYIFSIVVASRGRQEEQLAELARTRPAYIVVVGGPAFRHLTPLLLEHYTLETVKWRDYRAEIWARIRPAPFATGAASGLAEDPPHGGLRLSADAEPGAPDELVRRLDARRGIWTSPVIEATGDIGQVVLDWSPRSDLARNPTGMGFPTAEASYTQPPDDVRAILGMPTPSGRWTTFPRPDTQSVTVRFGFPTVTDRVVMQTISDGGPGAPPRIEIIATNSADTPFRPVTGLWESAGEATWSYRFAPQPLTAVRLLATPPGPGRGVALQRLFVPAVGMGVNVRYRTGPTPDLAEVPWVAVDDAEGARVVPAGRYVQMQCELWSEYEGMSPILRTAQIGRVRFRLTGDVTAPPGDLGPGARRATAGGADRS